MRLQRKLPEELQACKNLRRKLFNSTTALARRLAGGEIYRLQGDESDARTASNTTGVVRAVVTRGPERSS